MFSFLTNKLYKVFDLMKGINSLDESSLKDFFEVMRNNLIEADVPLVIIDKIVDNLNKKLIGTKINRNIKPGEYIAREFYNILLDLLQSNNKEGYRREILKNFVLESKKAKKPFILFLVGLQGAGKTTTIGKILHLMLEVGEKNGIKEKDLAVVSLDYDRPAAREQLSIVANSMHVDSISLFSSDSISAAHELQDKIENNKIDKRIIIVDTAGRVTLDRKMMDELKKMQQIIKPKEIFLVIDSMVSQEGVTIAEEFTKAVPCSGCIVTKVDSDAPGGIILGICYLLSLPILYITVGEKISDIKKFDPVATAKRLLGMGEIFELAKIADKKIAAAEEDQIKKAFQKDNVDMNDFIRILNAIKEIGPLKQMVSMLPRQLLGGVEIDSKKINEMEAFTDSIRYLAGSMTKKERLCPDLLQGNQSRIMRIANGSGISIEAARACLDSFFNMRQGFKMLKKFI